MFDSNGFALEDFIVLGVLERMASVLGLGAEVTANVGDDSHDPYASLRLSAEPSLRSLLDNPRQMRNGNPYGEMGAQ